MFETACQSFAHKIVRERRLGRSVSPSLQRAQWLYAMQRQAMHRQRRGCIQAYISSAISLPTAFNPLPYLNLLKKWCVECCTADGIGGLVPRILGLLQTTLQCATA